jgi:hypothetical protein
MYSTVIYQAFIRENHNVRPGTYLVICPTHSFALYQWHRSIEGLREFYHLIPTQANRNRLIIKAHFPAGDAYFKFVTENRLDRAVMGSMDIRGVVVHGDVFLDWHTQNMLASRVHRSMFVRNIHTRSGE